MSCLVLLSCPPSAFLFFDPADTHQVSTSISALLPAESLPCGVGGTEEQRVRHHFVPDKKRALVGGFLHTLGG